jgi:hypothetical protein
VRQARCSVERRDRASVVAPTRIPAFTCVDPVPYGGWVGRFARPVHRSILRGEAEYAKVHGLGRCEPLPRGAWS